MLKNFSKSKYAQYVLHPEIFNPSKKDTAATRRYEEIYNLFIEGDFEKAIKEKNAADSLYGKNYWNPQLLYIQSVYYIQKKTGQRCNEILNQIISQYPDIPIKEKAVTMIDVLRRRDSIENYLTNLNVERAKEDSQIVVFDMLKMVNNVKAPVNIIKNLWYPKEVVTPGKAEINPDKKLPPPIKNAAFTFDPYNRKM